MVIDDAAKICVPAQRRGFVSGAGSDAEFAGVSWLGVAAAEPIETPVAGAAPGAGAGSAVGLAVPPLWSEGWTVRWPVLLFAGVSSANATEEAAVSERMRVAADRHEKRFISELQQRDRDNERGLCKVRAKDKSRKSWGSS